MAKRQSTRKPATAPTTALARAPLPQQLAALQADRAWLLKQIRRKRTELDNFLEEMRFVFSSLLAHSAPFYEQLDAINAEIHALFAEIFASRRIRRRVKQQIEDLYLALQLKDIISPQSFEADEAGTYEDWEDPEGAPEGDRAPSEADPPGSGPASSAAPADAAAPAPQRAFRQTFLRLASIYHPDRAEDADTQQRNTAIMQEINSAYKSGDFARLLELEQQQLGGEDPTLNLSTEAEFERECQRLVRENANLREQYEGIKAELRKLRNQTEEGMLVATWRKARREGIDPLAAMLNELETSVEVMTSIRDFVQDFLARKISLKRFLAGPKPRQAPPAEFFEFDDIIIDDIIILR